jgi:hypothetical protein
LVPCDREHALRDPLADDWIPSMERKDLDIQEHTDPHHDPMIPHTFVLEPGLVVYTVYNGYWFWGRPSTAELWRDLREVTRKARPDWDLSAPGVRDNWEGERTRHWPYKRHA